MQEHENLLPIELFFSSFASLLSTRQSYSFFLMPYFHFILCFFVPRDFPTTILHVAASSLPFSLYILFFFRGISNKGEIALQSRMK